MTVIAADGTPVQPLPIDVVMLYPGERYDVHVRGLDAPSRKVYRIIIRTEERFRSPLNKTAYVPLHFYGLANLEYEDVQGDARGSDEGARCLKGER